MNGGPKRGPDLTDNHGIASRPQGPGRQSPRSRPRPKGDRTQGFTKKGVTRMSPSALLRLEALRKCRSCVWRAGCTKTCLSGSGGGGWIPLLPRGWPPTSSQDRSKAKPDEVVQTPVARLSGRAASRATNVYAVRTTEIVLTH